MYIETGRRENIETYTETGIGKSKNVHRNGNREILKFTRKRENRKY